MVNKGRPAFKVGSNTFGGQLRKARVAAGYASAKAFADALGVERPTVNRWESNIIHPPPTAIISINSLLGTNFPVLKKPKVAAAFAKKTLEQQSSDKQNSKVPGRKSADTPMMVRASQALAMEKRGKESNEGGKKKKRKGGDE